MLKSGLDAGQVCFGMNRPSGLRIPASRSVVGIDEFTIEPLRGEMRISERFIEIAHLLALFPYFWMIGHKPGNHPFRTVPSQNPLQFWNCLRLHAGLVQS